MPYPAYSSYATVGEPAPYPGGGCGGAPAVGPAPLQRPPAQVKITLEEFIGYIMCIQENDFCFQNDCCCGCSSPCKYKRRAAAYGNKTAVDPSCNNEDLRSLIQEVPNYFYFSTEL